MDFIQNLRVGQLAERFQYYSNPENVAKFSNDHIQTKFIVERWADGYVQFTDNTLKYKDLTTGKTFILRNKWEETDYTCYQALYQTGVSLGTFRFSVPVFREIVQSGSYEYLEFDTPLGEHGETHSTTFLEELNHDPKKIIKDYVDQFALMLEAVNAIASSNNVGFPLFGFLPDRLEDSVGYYWPELLEWNFTKELVTTEQLKFIGKFAEFPIKNNLMTEQDRSSLLAYAREAWRI